jgi:hypothetical protein
MDYISYIDLIIEIKSESLQKIEPFSINIEDQTYKISKKNLENNFIGEYSGKEYLIQFIEPIESLSSSINALKNLEPLIEIISGVKKTIHLIEDKIIIKSQVTRKVSLNDYFAFRTSARVTNSIKSKTQLCLDIIIKGLQEILSNLAAAEKNGFDVPNVNLEDVYIEITLNPLHPIFTLDSLGIELLIDPIGSKPLAPKQNNFMNGLALCLYSSLRNKLYVSIDSYLNELPKKKKKLLKIYPYALCNLIESLTNNNFKAEEILFTPAISTWIYLFQDYETIPSDPSFDPDTLLAGLYLKKKTSRDKAALIIILQQKANLIDFIKSKPCSAENFKRICMIICRNKFWKDRNDAFGISVYILKTVLSDCSYFVSQAGLLKLYKVLTVPNIDLELIERICSSYTMTGPCIVYESTPLLESISRSPSYLRVLPYMSSSTLSYLYDINPLSNLQKIEVLGLVPISIRRTNPKRTIDIVETICSKSDSQSYPSIIISALKIIREVVYEGKIAHDSNKQGRCYKNESQYNSSVLMAYCKKCDINLCLVCASSHIQSDHWLLYQRSDKMCKKTTEPLEFVKGLFEITEINLEFFDSQGTYDPENKFSTNDCREEISITTIGEIKAIYDNTRHSTLLYYELEILNAGFTENICIGIDGTGVFYSGNTGIIMDSEGKIKKQAARFGTGDVVGVGFTSSHFLYFTYNGYNLHLYKECTEVVDIRPLIKLKGPGIVVRVITSQFYFSQSTYENSLSFNDPYLKARISKLANKMNYSEDTAKKIEGHLKDVSDIILQNNKSQIQNSKTANPCKKMCRIS